MMYYRSLNDCTNDGGRRWLQFLVEEISHVLAMISHDKALNDDHDRFGRMVEILEWADSPEDLALRLADVWLLVTNAPLDVRRGVAHVLQRLDTAGDFGWFLVHLSADYAKLYIEEWGDARLTRSLEGWGDDADLIAERGRRRDVLDFFEAAVRSGPDGLVRLGLATLKTMDPGQRRLLMAEMRSRRPGKQLLLRDPDP
jgi:hypothetical protein